MDELPTEAYYDLTGPGGVTVSPGGERVAFTASESDPDGDEKVGSVFTVLADGSRDPHRLTRASAAWNVEWSPDGSKLGVLMARDTDTELRVGREEDGETDESEDKASDEEAEDEAGDADDEEDEENGANGDDEPKPQVWVYDLELGGDARQVTDREHGVRDFDWGPEGERVVIAARDPTDEEEEYLDQRGEGGPSRPSASSTSSTGRGGSTR
jgi:dipeptidyl aminopeptidase/acylaminoacyl peptidase